MASAAAHGGRPAGAWQLLSLQAQPSLQALGARCKPLEAGQLPCGGHMQPPCGGREHGHQIQTDAHKLWQRSLVGPDGERAEAAGGHQPRHGVADGDLKELAGHGRAHRGRSCSPGVRGAQWLLGARGGVAASGRQRCCGSCPRIAGPPAVGGCWRLLAWRSPDRRGAGAAAAAGARPCACGTNPRSPARRSGARRASRPARLRPVPRRSRAPAAPAARPRVAGAATPRPGPLPGQQSGARATAAGRGTAAAGGWWPWSPRGAATRP